jgi:hypothetical protein
MSAQGTLLENGRTRTRIVPTHRMDDVDFLLDLNRRHSELFTDAGEKDERELYREKHPTEIGASKCMDGRIHLPLLTETALGIIQPWRNIGGQFDLRWPFYAETIHQWQKYAKRRKRRCLKLVTYHFSRGKRERGCRGFGYDRHAAQAFAADLKSQFDTDFGRTTLYAVQCGIETDREALILHGDKGEVVDLSEVKDTSGKSIRRMLQGLYPDMRPRIVKDFIPLIRGNIRHTAKVQANADRDLEVDAEHQEWVLGVGRGFDWLHESNMALIVGPFAPDYSKVIKQAAGLIHQNLKEGRTNGHGIVLLSLAPYRKVGVEKNLRIRKARGFEQDALRAIEEMEETDPGLKEHLQVLTGVVNMETRAIEVLEHRSAV